MVMQSDFHLQSYCVAEGMPRAGLPEPGCEPPRASSLKRGSCSLRGELAGSSEFEGSTGKETSVSLSLSVLPRKPTKGS